ncbi:hypothetical protein B0H14DRAFT_3449775 [Mycena olivaceomarginata]|nr:hypothetical protein B0H14DRAFT_3449775 [Mycena olivaceomarginata]
MVRVRCGRRCTSPVHNDWADHHHLHNFAAHDHHQHIDLGTHDDHCNYASVDWRGGPLGPVWRYWMDRRHNLRGSLYLHHSKRLLLPVFVIPKEYCATSVVENTDTKTL